MPYTIHSQVAKAVVVMAVAVVLWCNSGSGSDYGTVSRGGSGRRSIVNGTCTGNPGSGSNSSSSGGGGGGGSGTGSGGGSGSST